MNDYDEDFDFKDLSGRKYLRIFSEENLKEIDFTMLQNVRELDLSEISTDKLPEDIVYLKKIKILNLSGNNFDRIPEFIKKLETLEELDIKENRITSFNIENLPSNLKKLDISGNRLGTIPEDIDEVKSLTWLDISDNYISYLPETICRSNLSYLSFEKNKQLLNSYPDCIDKMDIITCKPVEGEKEFSTYKCEKLYEEAEDAVINGEFEVAVQKLDELLKNEESPYAYYTRGFAFLECENYLRASDDFTKAIEMGGENEEYVAAKGVAHSRMEDFDRAVFYYSKAIELKESVENFENRAIAYNDMGEFEKAVLDFTEAIKLSDGSNSELYVLRAAAYKSLKDFDNSWRDLESAYEANPYEISTYLDSIEMFFTTEYYRKAFEYMEKHEGHILEYGDNRDKTIYFYLKTLVYTCCSIDTWDFEDKIWEYSAKTNDLKWYFGHIKRWLEDSGVNREKKIIIEELTRLLMESER